MATFSTDRTFSSLTTHLRIRGIQTWSEAIERFADQDICLLNLAYEGVCLRSESETDPLKMVEVWALKEALDECILLQTRCGHVFDPSVFVDALEDVVRWVIFYSGRM